MVKKDRKRKPSSIDGNTDVVICKLCNSYVVTSMIDTHNRYAHYIYFYIFLNSLNLRIASISWS